MTLNIDTSLNSSNPSSMNEMISILLQRFEDLISEHAIAEVNCMPYTHLEKFYSQIGFQKIRFEKAPIFLQQRAESFASTYPDQSVILMVRKA